MRRPGSCRRLADERGMTLVELLVAMSIMSIVIVVFGSVLASVQRTAMKEDRLGQTNDQIRLALEQIDHEMRSGNVMYDPSLENGSGSGALTSCSGCLPDYTMRIYTQTNVETRGQYMCVLWQVDDQQQLKTRMWPAGLPDQATAWRIVATGIVNRDLGIPAFSLDSDPLKGDRTLDVTLSANADLTHDPNGTVISQAAYTGRNTSYGYPTSLCSTTPS